MRLNRLIFLSLVVLSSKLHAFGSDECRSAIKALLKLDDTYQSKIVRTVDNAPVQFGFESEYAISESGKIFDHYQPSDPEILKVWSGLNQQQRIDYVTQHREVFFPEYRKNGNLILSKKTKNLYPFLPERLIMDDTGNIEFVFEPVNTLEESLENVKITNQMFGAGSMQITSSIPNSYFFKATPKENFGLFAFMSEFDYIQKYHEGYANNKISRAIVHPYLGPPNQIRMNKLRQHLIANANDIYVNSEIDVNDISTKVSSHKYMGSTVYRPDILYKKIARSVVEVRDAHKNEAIIKDRIIRATFLIMNDRSNFANIGKKITFFDPRTILKQLDFYAGKRSADMQANLKKLFPHNHGYTDLDQEEELCMETYRNLLLPLRDWSGLVNAMDSSNSESVLKTIEENKRVYVEKLSEILRLHSLIQNPTKEQVLKSQNDVLSIFSEFIYKSNIYGLMQEKEKQIVKAIINK